jgi:hypothetical protein
MIEALGVPHTESTAAPIQQIEGARFVRYNAFHRAQ